MSKTEGLNETFDKYFDLYDDRFGLTLFPGFLFKNNEEGIKQAIDVMKKCLEAGKNAYEMGFVDDKYFRKEETPLDHYLNCYEKKFGLNTYPTIPLLFGGEEWVIDSIKKCLKEGKDVYEMGYLEDPLSGVIY